MIQSGIDEVLANLAIILYLRDLGINSGKSI
jgi:hypothetical protein